MAACGRVWGPSSRWTLVAQSGLSLIGLDEMRVAGDGDSEGDDDDDMDDDGYAYNHYHGLEPHQHLHGDDDDNDSWVSVDDDDGTGRRPARERTGGRAGVRAGVDRESGWAGWKAPRRPLDSGMIVMP